MRFIKAAIRRTDMLDNAEREILCITPILGEEAREHLRIDDWHKALDAFDGCSSEIDNCVNALRGFTPGAQESITMSRRSPRSSTT